MAKKAKARVILVKLLSSAGTGFNYIKSRPRISPKLSMMKYDPMGKERIECRVLFFFLVSLIASLVKQHVLFTETKMKK
jgi:large subunit ribosomal protein L33